MSAAQTQPGDAAAIEVNHISRRFGQLQAVDDVSFTVAPGEIFGLLGPNGAGKSTLIRMLTTLIPPSGGGARVAGFDIVRQADEVRKSIGVIPQAMTSDPDLTCEENLSIHARLYDVPAKQRREITQRLLEAVQLETRAKAFARTLSGGMRRRLEIARGLVHNPTILFLDEPSTGLDPVSRMSVWELISKLREEHGLTLFLTTHYMDEADRLCDRLAIVDRGKIVVLDTPAALKASVPGASVIEAALAPDPPGAVEQLEQLPAVESARAEGSAVYRIFTDHGPSTAAALMEWTRSSNIQLTRLSVASTSLDDVFLHFTGRGLSEAQAAESGSPGPRRRP